MSINVRRVETALIPFFVSPAQQHDVLQQQLSAVIHNTSYDESFHSQ
jgi:hypothetical protein